MQVSVRSVVSFPCVDNIDRKHVARNLCFVDVHQQSLLEPARSLLLANCRPGAGEAAYSKANALPRAVGIIEQPAVTRTVATDPACRRKSQSPDALPLSSLHGVHPAAPTHLSASTSLRQKPCFLMLAAVEGDPPPARSTTNLLFLRRSPASRLHHRPAWQVAYP